MTIPEQINSRFKFRAWIVSAKKMIDWKRLLEREDRGLNLVETEDRKLMQYTGLKDKNGVEIYEGDLIKQGSLISEVIWREDFWGVGEGHYDDSSLYSCASRSEIVGNRYENPELLV